MRRYFHLSIFFPSPLTKCDLRLFYFSFHFSEKVHQFPHKSLRPVLKVYSKHDNRYTDSAGQYLHDLPLTRDTTYPIPRITHDRIHFPPQLIAYEPILKQLSIPHNGAGTAGPQLYKQNNGKDRNNIFVFTMFLRDNMFCIWFLSAYDAPIFHQSLSSPFSNYHFAIAYPPNWGLNNHLTADHVI